VRLVVVLGYSARGDLGLHPICAARVATAAEVASQEDTVVLTGRPEAELMRAAWQGRAVRVVCETDAGVTAESAAQVARLARELGATEVVAVTSWWHCRRTAFLFRKALRGSGVTVSTVGAPSWSGRLLLREAGAYALLPVQIRRARFSGGRTNG
jgi:uncharacterized SAM-binding protein YcdF (DUF218 family)